MWEEAVGPVVWQSALATLPLTVMRLLGWVLSGFAIALACGVAGVIAGLESERRKSPGC